MVSKVVLLDIYLIMIPTGSSERRLRLSKVMIISEKPTAAKRIAGALDEQGRPREVKGRSASYFECERNGDVLIVVYALGHLFELRQTVKGWTYPRLDTEWVPKYEVDKKASKTKPIISLIRKLSKDIDSFVIATDFDIEGSLIGYLTLMHGCKADPDKAKRMIFSTLTKKELEHAYDNPSPRLDFPMIEAGHARHEIDWLYGINLTRALTLSVKKVAGWFRIISTGRVQGPTLAFLAERDKKVKTFVPVPFWAIDAKGSYNNEELQLEYYKKKLDLKEEAQRIVDELRGGSLAVKAVSSKKMKQMAPVPFNLSVLQSESYRHFGFKPSRTLAIAQKLYLDALISYPRTGSQKLPPSIDFREILEGLNTTKYAQYASAILSRGILEPVQGTKDDPAHPAIHPTGKKPDRKLTPSEAKVYDLIVRRFLGAFYEPSIKELLRADLMAEEHLFHLRGLKIIKEGWMVVYGIYAGSKEKVLPPIKEGDNVQIVAIVADGRHSAPPVYFNPASLLKLLEKENLGTKATRASIVDSAQSRGYTLANNFELSPLGYSLHETLGMHVPAILSAEFTRSLEREMDSIQEGKGDKERVLSMAKEDLEGILTAFREHEEQIGEGLVRGLQGYWQASEEIGSCPKCGVGILSIIKSPKTGKRFVGCSQYKEGKCDQTFPLPQKGRIIPLEKKCPYCSHHMIKVISPRRAWETCINWASCPGRQEDLKVLQDRRSKSSESPEEEKS
ncbi:MAG: DNA topoisomerase I [Candidatus Thorarchaeota archaeon]|nr:DNA topoisomerase I [Candidatus Thorarchaeota archaeon]